MTGATGLVGQYLLRDFLSCDQRMAVIVRPSKMQTARERIESVMARWELLAGRSLPRPIVLSGNLTDENLGLDSSARRWIANNCQSVLHVAASMTFRESKQGEPHRTNVEGLERLLDLCRETRLTQFHHVSTAYLCGLREGRVLESELDLGQELGNVYEKSKLAAEKMVRNADFLDRLTVYRPASVVGDSETGYCNSLHGFYLPLQLAYTIAGQVPTEFMNERFFALLGLSGKEGKNLVPVDWLSTAISRLVLQPEHHGQTYHLASAQPATVRLIQEVIQDAISQHCDRQPAEPFSEEQMVALEQMFHDHMLIYRSHWRNDPTFDLTNTRQALPDLPCPEMNRDLLLRVAKYPIEKNFAVDRYQPTEIRYDAHTHLERWYQSSSVNGHATGNSQTVDLQINGSGGGQWQLAVSNNRLMQATPGLGAQASMAIYLSTDTFAALATRQRSVEESINNGQLLIQGIQGDAQPYVQLLNQITSPV